MKKAEALELRVLTEQLEDGESRPLDDQIWETLSQWYYSTMTHTTSPSHESYTLHLGNRGRLVLPASVRQRLALKEGDRLLLTVEPDGALRLVSARDVARQTRGLLRRMMPGLEDRRLADELIAERRAEAARD